MQQQEQQVLQHRIRILRNPHYGNYYHYFQTLFSSAYIGAYAVMSGQVEIRASTQGAIGDVVGSVIVQIPVIGVAGTVLKAVIRQLDQRHITQSMYNITKLANNMTEVDVIVELLASKAIDLQYEVLQQIPIEKITSYKKLMLNWYEGTPTLNLIENKASQDVEMILLKLAKRKIEFPERMHGKFKDHANYMADFILKQAFGIEGPVINEVTTTSRDEATSSALVPPEEACQALNKSLPLETLKSNHRRASYEVVLQSRPVSYVANAKQKTRGGAEHDGGNLSYVTMLRKTPLPAQQAKCCIIM
jgi:hypothetical protein